MYYILEKPRISAHVRLSSRRDDPGDLRKLVQVVDSLAHVSLSLRGFVLYGWSVHTYSISNSSFSSPCLRLEFAVSVTIVSGTEPGISTL